MFGAFAGFTGTSLACLSIEIFEELSTSLERSWDAAICLKAAQVVALNYRGASHRLIAELRKINDISSLARAYFINISPCSCLVLLFNMRYTNLLIVVSPLPCSMDR